MLRIKLEKLNHFTKQKYMKIKIWDYNKASNFEFSEGWHQFLETTLGL